MSRREFLYQHDLNSPLGDKSTFNNAFVDPAGTLYDIPIPEEKQYFYKIIVCDTGLDVFEYYKSDIYAPTERSAYIFVEKNNPEKANFFGTACRVKMDYEFRLLLQKIHSKSINISVEDSSVLAKNLVEFSHDIAATSKKVESNILYYAFLLEINQENAFSKGIEAIFSLNNKLADWMAKGIETVEEWKLTEENYDYQKYYLTPNYNKRNGFKNDNIFFKPLIPVPMIGSNGFTNQKISEKTALGQLEKMHDHFDELAMGIVIGIVKATPTVTDDVILAMVFYVKNYLEEKVLGQFKNVLLKAKKLLKEAITFVKNVITKTSEIGAQTIAMANALLCGIINGLLSLLQTILGLLAFLVGNFPLNEIEKALPKALAEHQEKLEFIEDFIDLITENIKSIFEGILNVFLNIKIWSEFFTFVKSLWKKGINTLKNTNEYFWAYVAGAIVFEVLVELVLAFFTGGTGNVAKAVAKISRAADKAKDILKQGSKIGQKIVKETTESIASIWKVLKREFEELIEAIKNGKFVSWLQKKFYQLIEESPSQDELLAHWDEISISRRGRRLGQRLRKVDIEYLIKELKKLKVELQLHPLEGSFPIEGFFIREGIPAMMPERAAAIFITDGTKMKIVLREEATIYEFFHEFIHYKHSQVLGLKKYLSLGGHGTLGELEKEQWVFDMLMKNKDYLTKSEIDHAVYYINDKVRNRFGKDPIDLDFDLSKIPEVRKEIKISEILKIK